MSWLRSSTDVLELNTATDRPRIVFPAFLPFHFCLLYRLILSDDPLTVQIEFSELFIHLSMSLSLLVRLSVRLSVCLVIFLPNNYL